MNLEVFTKNFARTKEITLPTTVVPRVGDEIKLAAKESGIDGIGMNSFLVHEVVYVIEQGELTPFVSCHATDAEHWRRSILQEKGWL